jgi:L-seryl-tRNA(Ser) seleniumtransferase
MASGAPAENKGATPYEGGQFLSDTGDHVRKWAEASRIIRHRYDHDLPLHDFSGLKRGLPLPQGLEGWTLDDEFASAIYGTKLRDLGLDHLGGDAEIHDVTVMNRLTAAIYAAMQVMVKPGATVIGVSASYSHPCVHRAVRDAGGRLVDTVGVEEFERALKDAPETSVVAITRLAVSYKALSTEDIERAAQLAHDHGALIIMDDAGGARVGPAMLGQRKSLEFGADLAATGLDKYGVSGPRVGLLGGRADLITAARARAIELGSECRPVLYPAVVECLSNYSPQLVRDLVASNTTVGEALRAKLGTYVTNTPFIFSLSGPGLLQELQRRAGTPIADLKPIEASALVAMGLLKEYGILTVHFAGMPPGTQDLMIKFIAADTVAAVGGPERFADIVDEVIGKASKISTDSALMGSTFFG